MSNSSWIPLAYVIASGSVSQISTDRFDAINHLRVLVRISGYSGGAIAQLRFNDDSGANYSWRVSSNFAVPTATISTTGIKVSTTSTVNPRALIVFDIPNINGRNHGITFMGSDQSESSATAPDIICGTGMWANTGQITKITLEGGGLNLLAGTDMAVYGCQGLGL